MNGVAMIKKEFLLRRETSSELSNNDVVVAEATSTTMTTTETDGKSEENNSDEPPNKKARTRKRGQNKNRPRTAKEDASSRLCQSRLQGVDPEIKCRYGEECRFMHDLPKYWETKPVDIGDRCWNFENFGRCSYGFACCFAGAHVNATEWRSVQKPILTTKLEKNLLQLDVKDELRYKRYNFDRSKKIIADITSSNASSSATETTTKPERKAKLLTDWAGKLYLAPLTTTGNLPFRRLCVGYGADITCGEMAMANEILQAKASEWALLKRHESERCFGVQLCGAHVDSLTKCAQLLTDQLDLDFIDVNLGCPIELICQKGAGCSLMVKTKRLEQIVRGMRTVMPPEVALTLKIRTGYQMNKNIAHTLVPNFNDWGISLFTIHGRSKEQRYTKCADWDYVANVAQAAQPVPCFGCGDVLNYEDYDRCLAQLPSTSGIMIARGALIKPWIFTEIKERRHWDISSSERFEIIKKYVNYGLEHWGSDRQGVETTRRFLLEFLSFLYRYIPVGLLERVPNRINERPPYFIGRDDLETMMASANCADWIKISEMLLGPVPDNFVFLPKHKANAY